MATVTIEVPDDAFASPAAVAEGVCPGDEEWRPPFTGIAGS